MFIRATSDVIRMGLQSESVEPWSLHGFDLVPGTLYYATQRLSKALPAGVTIVGRSLMDNAWVGEQWLIQADIDAIEALGTVILPLYPASGLDLSLAVDASHLVEQYLAQQA